MILVTGGFGCIGAELVKWLLRQTEHRVLLSSRRVSDERKARTFFDVETDRLECVSLDVSDQNQIEAVFGSYEISHIAHLAALQTPDCNAHRDLGLQINLGGTQRLIEIAKSYDSVQRFVFASSIGVYGPRASYPESRVPMLANPLPVNVYGVWKLASEQILRLFHEDTQVPTICLRPGVLYGPGRDLGLTSTPTTAMKHVALGLPYEIPFRSKQDYLYAPDVGAAFGSALTEPFDGYGCFTLPAHTLEMEQVVASINSAAEHLGIAEHCHVSMGNEEVPFICELEFEPVLDAFPSIPCTDFSVGVMRSIETFQTYVSKGWL